MIKCPMKHQIDAASSSADQVSILGIKVKAQLASKQSRVLVWACQSFKQYKYQQPIDEQW